LNDFSSLRYLHGLNCESGEAPLIDLIPHLDDPKDLFGGLNLRALRSHPAVREPA
jgi:ornithine cyclodeaminase